MHRYRRVNYRFKGKSRIVEGKKQKVKIVDRKVQKENKDRKEGSDGGGKGSRNKEIMPNNKLQNDD